MKRKALIIDDEVDFCLLIQYYLRKRNFGVSISHSFRKGLVLIERVEPDVIIANASLSFNLESLLHDKIKSIQGYTPRIFIFDSGFQINQIEEYFKDDDFEDKKQYEEHRETLLDEFKKLGKFIRKLFRF